MKREEEELTKLFELAENANRYGPIEQYLDPEVVEKLDEQAGVEIEFWNGDNDSALKTEKLNYSYGL